MKNWPEYRIASKQRYPKLAYKKSNYYNVFYLFYVKAKESQLINTWERFSTKKINIQINDLPKNITMDQIIDILPLTTNDNNYIDADNNLFYYKDETYFELYLKLSDDRANIIISYNYRLKERNTDIIMVNVNLQLCCLESTNMASLPLYL